MKNKEQVKDKYSWLEKFYKKDVESEDCTKWSDKKCAKHTMLKYKGVLKISDYGLKLDRADLVVDNGEDEYFFFITDTVLSFNTSSCSFCQKYYIEESTCKRCPLYKEGHDCEKGSSAYRLFVNKQDPQPMLSLMEKIISKCDDKGNYKK